MLSEWYDAKINYRWRCSQCKVEQSVYKMDWQHKAAFYRYGFSIEISSAIPTKKILEALHQITGTPWQYMYGHI